MVCREYDDRILKRAGLFEGIKYLANALVNKIDHRVSITYPLVALMRAEHAGLILLAGAVAVRQQAKALEYLFIHELRDLIRALSALFLGKHGVGGEALLHFGISGSGWRSPPRALQPPIRPFRRAHDTICRSGPAASSHGRR